MRHNTHAHLALLPFRSSQSSFALPDSHPLLREGARSSISTSTSIESSSSFAVVFEVTVVEEPDTESMGGLGHIFIFESSPPVMRTLFYVQGNELQSSRYGMETTDGLIPQKRSDHSNVSIRPQSVYGPRSSGARQVRGGDKSDITSTE